MTETTGPAGERVRFTALTAEALTALLDGDISRASEEAGVPLTDWFTTREAEWVWRFRLGQFAADPAAVRWALPQAVTVDGGPAVGYCGFHGPPGEARTVEIGYSVAPAFRRRGYATAMVAGLLRRAAAEPAVTTVRASVRPDNTGSLATLERFGFLPVGEQWDEEDGLELVFEVPAAGGGHL
ncbi:GNAT family N-acetyltransferase [Streptomyces sp. NPDC049881]|uniref:GNAT family N-acetyltransferase n=1 Tax=Streptomyces sp. NPDC049881 TaxID=3155778 RepID=UPI00342BF2D7